MSNTSNTPPASPPSKTPYALRVTCQCGVCRGRTTWAMTTGGLGDHIRESLALNVATVTPLYG